MIQFQFLCQAAAAVKIICVVQKAEPEADKWHLEDQAQTGTCMTRFFSAIVTITYLNNISLTKRSSHAFIQPPLCHLSWWQWGVSKVTGLTPATCSPHANASLSKRLNPKLVLKLCLQGGGFSPPMSWRLPRSSSLRPRCDCDM